MNEIHDPLIEPYHLIKQKYGWDISVSVKPQEKYVVSGNGKIYIKWVRYYKEISDCLEYIARKLTNQRSYSSVKDYCNAYNSLFDKIKKLNPSHD